MRENIYRINLPVSYFKKSSPFEFFSTQIVKFKLMNVLLPVTHPFKHFFVPFFRNILYIINEFYAYLCYFQRTVSYLFTSPWNNRIIYWNTLQLKRIIDFLIQYFYRVQNTTHDYRELSYPFITKIFIPVI